MRFPKIKIPPFLATAAKRVQERLRRVWRRIAIRKADVVTERDLWFYHTRRIVTILLVFVGLSTLIAVTFINMWREGEGMSAVPDVGAKRYHISARVLVPATDPSRVNAVLP